MKHAKKKKEVEVKDIIQLITTLINLLIALMNLLK